MKISIMSTLFLGGRPPCEPTMRVPLESGRQIRRSQLSCQLRHSCQSDFCLRIKSHDPATRRFFQYSAATGLSPPFTQRYLSGKHTKKTCAHSIFDNGVRRRVNTTNNFEILLNVPIELVSSVHDCVRSWIFVGRKKIRFRSRLCAYFSRCTYISSLVSSMKKR